MKPKITTILPVVLVAVFFIIRAGAQQQSPMPVHPPHPDSPQPLSPKPDPLAHLMFPPDLIMGHARQLGLTDEQKTFMRGEIQKTTVSFHELQWKLQDQMELLHEAMKSTSVNEQQVLAQLDRVLDVEREIKRLHLGLAVRLKNRLTPEQQEQLHKMRMEHHVRTPGPGNPQKL